MSGEYTAGLAAQGSAAAQRGDRLAAGLLEQWDALSPEQRAAALADLKAANTEAAGLRRQVAWHRRRTGWASPASPAWTD